MGTGASRDSFVVNMREQIVLTPRVKTDNFTAIVIERRVVDPQDAIGHPHFHVAGGSHSGIIINKRRPNPCDYRGGGGRGGGGDADTYHLLEPPQTSSEFQVFLVSSSSSNQNCFWERRKLNFWFKNDKVPEEEREAYGHQFFTEVLGGGEGNHDKDFPRDYVGFITKVLKLMQLRYDGVKRIKLEFEKLKLGETDEVGKWDELMERQVLEMIEGAYPNPLSIQEIIRRASITEEHVRLLISRLQRKNLIKSIAGGDGINPFFTRIVLNDKNTRVVKQMPEMVQSKQPTFAIITSHFFEKLAVDAMLENQETFVRHGILGESNVFTLGNIGNHRVVSTKLPVSEGNKNDDREAMISSGNRTTRLLGTFQNVDYVILIGICGGVLRNNVRIGDVVVSSPSELQHYAYLHCRKEGNDLKISRWTPSSLKLQEIAKELQREENWETEWAVVAQQGLDILSEQQKEQDYYDFSRVRIAERERQIERKVHLGPIASGKDIANITRDDSVRQELISELNVLAFDSEENDCVIESIIGNRRNCFAVISGVADYKDGSSGRKESHPYVALLAASFAKLMITRIASTAEA
ncbi:unnamed protein product [Orchesella dallaii]|uniref:Nucleoside phosphorylase domain-containing protein n=1 Tax=Orchesella dallaii TaxID=48710 RepID=A0ABP1QC36_9HEXA